MADDRRLLTASEAAVEFGVSDETLRRWARAHRISFVRLPSGQIRFRPEDVERALQPVDPPPAAAAS